MTFQGLMIVGPFLLSNNFQIHELKWFCAITLFICSKIISYTVFKSSKFCFFCIFWPYFSSSKVITTLSILGVRCSSLDSGELSTLPFR